MTTNNAGLLANVRSEKTQLNTERRSTMAKQNRLLATKTVRLKKDELNVRYFSGYLTILWVSRFRSLMLVLPRDPALGPTLIVPGQETGNALGTSWVPDRVIYPDQENVVPYTVSALRAVPNGTKISQTPLAGLTTNGAATRCTVCS